MEKGAEGELFNECADSIDALEREAATGDDIAADEAFESFGIGSD